MPKMTGKIISDGIVTVLKEVKNREMPQRGLFINEGSLAKLKGKNNWKIEHS